jgi:hypothetical protein
VSEFNQRDPHAPPLQRQRDGRYSVALNSARGYDHRLGHWLAETRWENDAQAVGYLCTVSMRL